MVRKWGIITMFVVSLLTLITAFLLLNGRIWGNALLVAKEDGYTAIVFSLLAFLLSVLMIIKTWRRH